MNARQVIIRPSISEKSYALLAANKYTFRVTRAEQDPGAPGGRGASACASTGVRTAWVKPKPKRRGFTKGQRRSGRRPS